MTPNTSLLFLIAFLVGSDEFLLGPILTPIGADLGVAPERITLFIGAYALPLAILAPGLQTHLARLSETRTGTLMALGSSAMNLGVAMWSAMAAAGFALAPWLVAVQALLTVGLAIAALRPIADPERAR